MSYDACRDCCRGVWPFRDGTSAGMEGILRALEIYINLQGKLCGPPVPAFADVQWRVGTADPGRVFLAMVCREGTSAGEMVLNSGSRRKCPYRWHFLSTGSLNYFFDSTWDPVTSCCLEIWIH
jgi:hypothetical protein